MSKLTFWHGTTKEGWAFVKKQGSLIYPRATEMFPNASPCVYLAKSRDEAEQYGDVILKIMYDPRKNPDKNNYIKNGWQMRVYEPIPLKDVKHIATYEFRLRGDT